MSLLGKFIQGSKYTGYTEYSRRSNQSILKIQEPVGFEYFSEPNIAAILQPLRSLNKDIGFGDIQNVMINFFYVYGSNKAMYIDPMNVQAVSFMVKALNTRTIRELTKRMRADGSHNTIYQNVLDYPNKVSANPQSDKLLTKTLENRRYGKPPTEEQLRKPYIGREGHGDRMDGRRYSLVDF
jgi:hypothetical protein